MSWLIIGGDGQLGQSFRDLFTERKISFSFSTIDSLDITDASAVATYINDYSPDVVVNCAAWTAVDAAEDNIEAAFAVNCDGARNVAIASRQVNAQHVLVSTDYVFAGNATLPYAEDDPTEPVSVYGKSKLCGEHAVIEEYKTATYVVRTAWLYSKYGHNFVKTMVRKALAGEQVRVVNDQLGQPTHAKDLAEHIFEIVTSHAPVGIYHGTNSGQTTWFELTQNIYQLLGADTSLVTPVSSSEYVTKAARPSFSVLEHKKTIEVEIPVMQFWDNALKVNMPEIRSAIESEKK